MFNITSALTGAAITGLTSPTYTFTQDIAPNATSKQFVVTALGGTQIGVNLHSITDPFTVTFFRAPKLQTITIDPKTQAVKAIPVNSHRLLTRKAASCNATVKKVNSIDVTVNIYAGSETFDKPNVDALFSAAIGTLMTQQQGIRDTVSSGIM